MERDFRNESSHQQFSFSFLFLFCFLSRPQGDVQFFLFIYLYVFNGNIVRPWGQLLNSGSKRDFAKKKILLYGHFRGCWLAAFTFFAPKPPAFSKNFQKNEKMKKRRAKFKNIV
jgi:hypothetical protein